MGAQSQASVCVAACFLAASAGLAAGSHWGDDWESQLAGLFLTPAGTPVVLGASWDSWSPWPLPTDPSRLHNLEVSFAVGSLAGIDAGLVAMANPGISYTLLRVQGDIPVFGLTLTADNLVWNTLWTWDNYEGCQWNMLQGNLVALHGPTTLGGEVLTPAAWPYTEIYGQGLSRKVGPGEDGFYECWPGNFP